MSLFSALFFVVIFLLCVKESAVVDIVGKVLTPALLLGLLILIVKGVIDPIGPVPTRTLVENVPATGIEAGYQTMDVLAAIVFGYVILKSAREKGHTDSAAQLQVVSGASAVAGAGLLVVYLGLTYLGATTARFSMRTSAVPSAPAMRTTASSSSPRLWSGWATVSQWAAAAAIAA